MRVPAEIAYALLYDKAGGLQPLNPGSKLHAGKPSYKIEKATQQDPSVGARLRPRRPASGRSHPTAKTGGAKFTARSHGPESPRRRLLLPTVPDGPDPSEVITISDDSADESGPEDLDLVSESGDHLGAVNGDDKTTPKGVKRSISSGRVEW